MSESNILQEFGNKTALHGATYVTEKSKLIIRIFWIIIIICGFIGAIVLVNDSYKNWQEKPDLTTIDSYFYPVQKIEAPTVTICAEDFGYDKWGFLRTLLGQFEFQCDGAKNCSKTEPIRKKFAPFLIPYKRTLAKIINDAIDNGKVVLKEFMCDYINKNETLCPLIFNTAVKFVKDYIKSGHSLRDLNNNLNNYLVGKNIDLDPMFSTLISFGVPSDFNNTKTDPFASEIVEKLAIKSALIRVIGRPGNLGTILTNFAHIVVNSTFDHEREFQTMWPYVYMRDYFTPLENELYELFRNITKDIFNPREEISPLDIPAIFDEKKYYSDGKTWRSVFPYSANISYEKYNVSVADFYMSVQHQNYYGKIISENEENLKSSINMMILSTLGDWPFSNFTGHHKFVRSAFSKVFENMDMPLFDLNKPQKKPYGESKEIFYMPGQSVTKRSFLDITGLFYREFPNKNTIKQFSDNGLCTVINSKPIKDIMKMPQEKDFLSQSLFEINRNVNHSLEHIEGHGTLFAQQILLTSPLTLHKGMPQNGHFVLSLNHWMDFFDNKYTGREIQMGYVTYIEVIPTKHITTSDFKDLTIDQRKCRFSHETLDQPSMFNYYSQRGCWFECGLRFAKMKYKCVPWHLPRNHNDTVCDGTMALKFDQYIYENMENCSKSCLPDCETITYQTHVSKKAIETSKLCGETIELKFGQSFKKIDATDGAQFFWRIDQLMKNETNITLQHGHFYFQDNLYGNYYDWLKGGYCEKIGMREFAVVEIVVSSPFAVVVKKDVRVTWSDKFGLIGGTVGLFTGLSIISVVETIYWGIIAIGRCCKRKKNEEPAC